MKLQVTDIQAQKKRDGYYSIFIDEQYSFSLSELDLSSSGLRIGQSLSSSELEDLQKKSLASKAYNRAIYYLRYGPRATNQMKRYLATKGGFESEEIETAIDRLLDEHYLDDNAYVSSYINSKQISKPRSKRFLSAELRKKGIDVSIIDQELAEIDDDSQVQSVIQIAQKKVTQPRFKDQKKLIEYLIRQGFSYSIVKRALQELSESSEK